MDIISQKTQKARGGILTAPPSKSHSVRAILIAALAEGRSRLREVLDADDSHSAIEAARGLGAEVTVTKGENLELEIKSRGIRAYKGGADLFTGDSGITTRFLLPMLGLGTGEGLSTVDCGAQMRERPIRPLVAALRALGMKIEEGDSKEGYPLRVSGRLEGGAAEVSGLTSQYISALLLSLPLAPKDSHVAVRDLRERPYVEMTLDWLRRGNIHYEQERQDGSDIFHIRGGQHYEPLNISIPADFSSASYMIAGAVLVPGKTTIRGLLEDDSQGDKALIDLAKRMGAKIEWSGGALLVEGGYPLRGIDIDCSDIPDLLPTLAILGTHAAGTTRLMNVPQARIKETDRIASMAAGLRAMGAEIEELPDGLVIRESALHGNTVDGKGDHRTVMALALAGLIADGTTVISSGEAIRKTFPGYVEVMQSLGANIKTA